MNKVLGVIFALVCFSTITLLSNHLGGGFWFANGIVALIAYSQFVPLLKRVGAWFAVLLGGISTLTFLFSLIAARASGTFTLDDRSALLLFLFFMIAVLGITLGVINKKIPEKVLLEN